MIVHLLLTIEIHPAHVTKRFLLHGSPSSSPVAKRFTWPLSKQQIKINASGEASYVFWCLVTCFWAWCLVTCFVMCRFRLSIVWYSCDTSLVHCFRLSDKIFSDAWQHRLCHECWQSRRNNSKFLQWYTVTYSRVPGKMVSAHGSHVFWGLVTCFRGPGNMR